MCFYCVCVRLWWFAMNKLKCLCDKVRASSAGCPFDFSPRIVNHLARFSHWTSKTQFNRPSARHANLVKSEHVDMLSTKYIHWQE